MAILPFTAPTKCRPGTLAMHPDHGLCSVIRAHGAMRTLLCETRIPDAVPDTSDLGPDERPEDILFSEQIETFEVEVDVNRLTEVPPDPDPMKWPVSRITRQDRRWGKEPLFQLPHAGTVTRFTPPQLCPVGSLVWLPEHGLCEVTGNSGVTGEWRTVFRETREFDAQGESVWGGEEMVVLVEDMRWLRPEVEFRRGPRGAVSDFRARV